MEDFTKRAIAAMTCGAAFLLGMSFIVGTSNRDPTFEQGIEMPLQPAPATSQIEFSQLSQADYEILQSLPPMCISDLPAFDFKTAPEKGEKGADFQQQPAQAPSTSTAFPKAQTQFPAMDITAGNRTNFEARTVTYLNEPTAGDDLPPSGRHPFAEQTGAAPPIAHQSAVPRSFAPHPIGKTPRPSNESGADPHFEVFSRDAFPSAKDCATCHQQIYEEWSVSSHAYSAVSPMFHAFEDTINRLSQGTIGYFCLRCHAPVATTMGLRRDQAIWDGPRVFREGVTCVVCHRVKTPYVKVNGERRIEPGDIYQPVYGSSDGTGVDIANKYAQFFKIKTDPTDTSPSQPIHRQSIQFEEIKESTFCVSCHQVAVKPGIKLEVVWDQYRASPAYREGVTCQDCHTGKVPGVNAGYAIGPAAVVNDKVVNPERKHSHHGFYGPGYSIAHPGVFPDNLKADRWKFNQWLLFDWRAGWGTDAFEDALAAGKIQAHFPAEWQSTDARYDAREVIEENLKKVATKTDLRRQLLENGSKLDGPFFPKNLKSGETLNFRYCLTNLNSGHNMPSGSLGAQPQIWMNVALIDPSGTRIWETGYTDSIGDLADRHSLDVLARKIPLDTQLMNLQTRFLTQNVKGTDREMYLPVSFDFDQLPFLRPPQQPVTVMNHPASIRMEAHSIPPLGSRNAKYSVPAKLIRQPGVYRLSVRLRSRAEPIYFMKFCNATPEMIRSMNEGIVDFHVSTVMFEVH